MLAVLASRPEVILQTGDFAERDDLVMLGVAHRACMEVARARLESGLFRDRPASSFPPATATEVDNDGWTLHLPPAGGACPFCGRRDDLSDEDIWPQWFWNRLREAGARFRTPPSVTTPVCATCNNRWMSVIENDASEILKPMVVGQPVQLTAASTKIVATWAYKIALLTDVLAEEPSIPRGYFQQFGLEKAPSTGFVVLIGAYAGHDLAAWAHARPCRFGVADNGQPAVDQGPNGVVVTFTAGRVVFQVIGHFNRGTATMRDARLQYGNALMPIWPSSPVPIRWPPRVRFATPADLEALDASVVDG